LTIAGKKRIAMIKSIDRNPVKSTIRHVSFHAVKANEVVTAEVPIHLTGIGESEAEKAGLVVLQAIEEIEVKARPAALPESLEVSLEGLATVEDKLTLGDIVLPKDVTFADAEIDLELVVANVYEPAALQAANDAAGGDAEGADADAVEVEQGGDATSVEDK
jgi:large subunit ribosomal protein L25